MSRRTERPVFTAGLDRYRFVWEDTASEITISRLAEGRNGELRGEIKVRCALEGQTSTIHQAQINLLADTTVSRLAKSLSERVPSVPWSDHLLSVVELSVDHFRSGEPLVDLFELDEPEDTGGPDWTLEPFVLGSGASVFFALGGSGKGYLACAMALSIATGEPILGTKPAVTGPVAYLDWEASQGDTHKRLLRVARGLGISGRDVHYTRPKSSLASIADARAQEFEDRGIVACVVDSLGLARGAGVESSEDTIRMFNAIARLGVPCICIDHVSKSASVGDGPDMPIGSVYTQNSARQVWSIRSTSTAGEIRMHLRNTKINEGPKARDRFVTVGFEGRQVTFGLGAPPPPSSGTLWEQMMPLLAEGAATVKEIARRLDKTDSTVRKELHRKAEKGYCHQLGGTDLWTLAVPLEDPY